MENDLNYRIKNHTFVLCNKQKTMFFNNKTSKYIQSTKNGGSYGIWVNGNWLTRSKINVVNNIKVGNMSKDLENILSQF